MDWEQKLPFLREKGHVISLTGGGGKTTLMYAMASHCAGKGWKVLVLTTTHIRKPDGKPVLVFKPDSYQEELQKERDRLWQQNQFVVAGTPAKDDKLMALPREMQDDWIRAADIVFVESDGSKRYPCKFPAAHEPVILPQSDVVLEVAGLRALGRSLEEICFRWELAWKFWEKRETAERKKIDAAQIEPWQKKPDEKQMPGQAQEKMGQTGETQADGGEPGRMPLTAEFLAWLLGSECGGRKGVGDCRFVVICNQADTPELQEAGQMVLNILEKQYKISGILTSFQEKDRNRERDDG